MFYFTRQNLLVVRIIIHLRKSSNSSSVTPGDVAKGSNLNICETELEENRDPISPLGHFATSLFSKCTLIIASGSSLDEPPPAETFTGCNVMGDYWRSSFRPERTRGRRSDPRGPWDSEPEWD
ncbi:hypothetical protein ACFX13_033636 [Malus domestica]